MCDVCRKMPCDSKCPNAPESPIVFTCEKCGSSIRVDDDYAVIGCSNYCMDCCSIKTAEFDDIETEDYP